MKLPKRTFFLCMISFAVILVTVAIPNWHVLTKVHYNARRCDSFRKDNGFHGIRGSSSYLSTIQPDSALKWYGTRDITMCFDEIRQRRLPEFSSKKCKSNSTYFAFVGDSRIRHHFMSFLKILPVYDSEHIQKNKTTKHDDQHWSSKTLGIKLSFYWQPTLENGLYHLLEKWHSGDSPDFILIGLALWHMRPLAEGTPEYVLFENGMQALKELLNKLAEKTTIVMLSQFPTIELIGTADGVNTYIHASKIFEYDRRMQHIFRDSRVELWVTGTKLVEEYIRSCALSRNSRQAALDDMGPAHYRCSDFTHPGLVAMFQATQILFNYMCTF